MAPEADLPFRVKLKLVQFHKECITLVTATIHLNHLSLIHFHKFIPFALHLVLAYFRIFLQ